MKVISFVQLMERPSHVFVGSKLHEHVCGMPFFLVVVVVGMKQSMQACATEYMAPIINKIGRVCGFVGCMGEFVWTNITMLEK